MKTNKFFGAVAAVSAMYILIPNQSAHAHGWAEFPEARQSICYEQGGLWSGTPPNAACAQAKAISGTYPFIQRNEFAINIPAPTYNDMEVVKAAIPDGSLCYANDAQKSGMGAEHSQWTRTELPTGTFEYVFNATAPHNPSFWQFYLTKPGVDVSKPLKWDDLELIQEYGNVAVDADKKYRMDIAIPADRSGDAILFTRWQRDDTVGEGFYNCSDITISGDSPVEPVPSEPYLEQGDAFIPADISLNTPQLGESVNYKVFSDNGDIHSSFSLEITADNQLDWDRLLASQVNGYYETQYSGNVFIGRWHAEMNHYMYFRNELHNNFFNATNGQAYGEFSITANNEFVEAVITPTVLKEITNASVTHGEYVVLTPASSKGDIEQISWVQVAGLPIETAIGQNDELIINTVLLENVAQEVSFELTVSGQGEEDKTVYSFTITPTDVEPGPSPEPLPGEQWSASAVYNGGEKVMHNNQEWTAQWWTQGEEPGTTGEWGVWR
ncbi:lytic polysaccharide monooxygenase [Shewanella sp. 10N.286.48.A6]|uniref:lytic polysaccharide monooxygenase n=1 Tax=Shewanella sp. 10N.286.48.A6 TaxID=1880833 RepID=UPI000C830677|nr:lytic polysaccharide monooxygenase [Shewanella sp. 10N.286.48.A6]PMH98217.1 chitin-binding protein [Shewanella sp. 10N.286.48.A6]